MNMRSTAVPLVAGVALLERAIGYTLGSLLLAPAEDLHRPTPCAEWDLAALLGHMNDSLEALEEATLGRVALELSHDAVDPLPAVGSLRARACRLLGEWNRDGLDDHHVSVGGMALPASLVAATGALEIAVHGWDVSRACGRSRVIPAPLADELLELAPLLVTDSRDDAFGPVVEVGPAAAPSDRLVAFLGRVPA